MVGHVVKGGSAKSKSIWLEDMLQHPLHKSESSKAAEGGGGGLHKILKWEGG